MSRLQAFYDGIYTGLDPIGTVIGNLTDNKYFTGYIADKYSLNKAQSDMMHLRPVMDALHQDYNEPGSIDRTVSEEVFKGVGDTIGLAGNVLLVGLPQLTFLFGAGSRYHQKLRNENFSAELAYRVINRAKR